MVDAGDGLRKHQKQSDFRIPIFSSAEEGGTNLARLIFNSWFSLTSYQNSEAVNNRFRFLNVCEIVKGVKLHIWAKF